ncbi:MAG TPA: hypothetical protein VGH19_08715 [Verrucomicrobiae bacterium]
MMMHRSLVMLFCLSAVLAAQAVYLPGQGPPALRFQPRTTGRAKLPPLTSVMPTNEPVTVTNIIEVTNFVTVTLTNVVESSPVLPADAAANAGTTNVQMIAPLPEAQAMSPTVLMQFFRDRKATNQASTTVLAPVGFAPPPVTVPSSTATFEKK